MIPRTMLHSVLLPPLVMVLMVLLTRVLGAKLSNVIMELHVTSLLIVLITSRLSMERALCMELLLVCTVRCSMFGLVLTRLLL